MQVVLAVRVSNNEDKQNCRCGDCDRLVTVFTLYVAYTRHNNDNRSTNLVRVVAGRACGAAEAPDISASEVSTTALNNPVRVRGATF